MLNNSFPGQKFTAKALSTGDYGFFTAEIGHFPLEVVRISHPQLLWLNRRVMDLDPKFHQLGSSVSTYIEHLLSACAFALEEGLDEKASVANRALAVADRYGGGGIGHNGGSGRNASINGYLVKGIGRTPLVSHLTPLSHASGGAYLEECARETVFAEIVDQEFPYGGVPTLAIIDTGLIQTWPHGIWPKQERRTLLVRPQFLRPAHFERAIGFLSGNVKEGALDQRRVVAVFGEAIDQYGRDGLIQMFETFWTRWAHQLAYGFVHRLPHGNNTSSNIAFDGRLVDFGAMSAVPSWASTATSTYPDPYGSRFDGVVGAMRSLSYYFGRHLKPALAEEGAVEARVRRSLADFRRFTALESLRLCGVLDDTTFSVMSSKQAEEVWDAVQRTIKHYQTEHIDFIDAAEMPKFAWDLEQVWLAKPPAHLRRLGAVLRDLVPVASWSESAQLCERRTASRPSLYKPLARKAFFESMNEVSPIGPHADARQIGKYIDSTVAANLRDSTVD